MKSNNLIIKLILLFVFVTSGWAGHKVTYGSFGDNIGVFEYYSQGDTTQIDSAIEELKNSSVVYAQVRSSKLQFGLRYYANIFNPYVKITFKISSNPSVEAMSVGVLSRDGKNFVSNATKTYDGSYYIYLIAEDTSSRRDGIVILKSKKAIRISAISEVPSKPTTILASDGTYSDRVKINSYSVTGATEYKIYRDGILIRTTKLTSIYDTNVNPGRTYSYKVKACNSTCSDYSTSNSGYAAVANSAPTVSGLNKTSFEATNSTQDLRIYGSNFTSSSVVYIDYGSGYIAQSSTYTHYLKSGEIKFDLKTTTSATGTWKVKVKNGTTLSSSYRSFNISQSTPSAPTVSGLNVVESGSGNGAVKATFSVLSSASLTTLRAHCSTNSSVSSSSSYFYTWKNASSMSTGSKIIYLTNSNWAGKRVYCKIEATDSNGNKADIIVDSVVLSDSGIDNKPTVVADNDTGLKWAIISENASWRNSITTCEDLVTDEGSTWRTPNINELYSITDLSKRSKFVKSALSSVDSKIYWSSTTNPNSPSQAMGVSFSGSSTYSVSSSKSDAHGIICVK